MAFDRPKGIVTPRTPVSTEQRVVELTLQRKSANEISAVTGITPRTVQRIRNRYDVSQGPTWPPLSRERKALVARLLSEGMSHCEIERTTGVHHDTIKRHFPGTAWSAEQSYNFAAQVSAVNRRARRAGKPTVTVV